METLDLAAALESAWKMRMNEGGAVVVTVVASHLIEVAVGARMVVGARGASEGALPAWLRSRVVADAESALRSKTSELRSYIREVQAAQPAQLQHGDLDIFFEVLAEPPRLVIVGAGHIATPLSRIAALADFRVTIVDDRADMATRERFPDAQDLLLGPYREIIKKVPMDGDTYVVLVTRGHVHDQACLEEVATTGARYVGMIGSKLRVRTVLEHAAANGVDPSALKRVRAPIGLDIGAYTPAEIAISIMAEIIDVRRQGGRRPSLSSPSVGRD